MKSEDFIQLRSLLETYVTVPSSVDFQGHPPSNLRVPAN